MRLVSAILADPVQLSSGKAIKDLPGEEQEVDLVVKYDRQVLEIHQAGRLACVVPLAGVKHMLPLESGYTCDVCGEGFESPQGLGPHRRHAHGAKAE